MYPAIRNLLMFLSVVALMATPAFAETKELFLAHVGAPGSIFDLAANEFARRANEKLPPEYRVVPAGSSRFGYDTAVLEKLKTGEVAFGLPGAVMSTISPKFGVFELPFLIRDRDQIRRISDAMMEPIFQPEAKAKGFRILAIWENGFRQFTNNVRPIKKPADIRGLKLRVPKTPWWEKVFRTLGVEPVPIETAKVYESLKTGVIDGQEQPLQHLVSGKLYEQQRYLSLSDHIFTPMYLIVGDEPFSKLPPKVQKILLETAAEMREWVFGTAATLENNYLDQVSEVMEVNHIDVKAFRRACLPIYDEFARTVPGGFKLIEMMSELANVPPSEVGLSATNAGASAASASPSTPSSSSTSATAGSTTTPSGQTASSTEACARQSAVNSEKARLFTAIGCRL